MSHFFFIFLPRRKIVYLTFCILGISALSPWTFFTTPSSYWMYKFRDVNATDDDVDPHDKTELQKTFLSYLSLVATTTSTACLILNAFLCQRSVTQDAFRSVNEDKNQSSDSQYHRSQMQFDLPSRMIASTNFQTDCDN